ncbi:MAG TPA: hypothetical protein DCS23_03355 [Candidatus Yonathbacteria bacterium]|nr:hypothetical protein [Candidatus Yonathbacteria bacterium]
MKQKLFDLIFRIYRIAGRILIRYSSNPRPSSYPYITGDGFRNFADHIYDDLRKDFDVGSVRDKDVIFVGDSNIKKFLTEVHPKIESPYVLVTHNGDAVIDQEIFSMADDKIIKWYGINVLIANSKVVPIPLGIENKHYYVLGIPSIFNRVIMKNIAKMDRIFYGFTVVNNLGERQQAMDVLKVNPLADTYKRWMNFFQYLPFLATYKFIASPPGSCVEGHRTWDALYIGSVPIVKSSITIDYFEKIGIPLWSVRDWHELDNLSEKDLADKFESIKKNSNYEPLYMDYWTDKIRNIKD